MRNPTGDQLEEEEEEDHMMIHFMTNVRCTTPCSLGVISVVVFVKHGKV